MRILSRESLFPHLEKASEYLFEVTNKAMVIFESFF